MPNSPAGYLDGHVDQALFNNPTAIAVFPFGNDIFVADTGNHKIRLVHSSGSPATVEGTWSFTDPSITPALSTSSQSVTFTPSDPNWAIVRTNVNVAVNKATPVITWSNPASITYGTQLS